MSEEVKNQTAEDFFKQKDPAALPENFFEEGNRQEEEEFKNTYAAPPVVSGKPEINEDLLDEGPDNDEDDADADLNFDESLEAAEKAELDDLNAKLGTNFADLNELKQMLKKSDNQEELPQIEQSRRLVEYFKDVLDYDDETIVREDNKIKAKSKGIDISSMEFQDDLEMEIDKMKDSGVLKYAAENLRQMVGSKMNENIAKVQEFENRQQLTEKQKEEQFRETVQAGIQDIYKKGVYLGIKVEKQDMLDIYSNVNKNKHIKHLKEHPEDAVKFEFFKRHEDLIMKALDRPDFQAGVQKTLKELGMQTSESRRKTAPQSKTGTTGDLSFLQRFTQ